MVAARDMPVDATTIDLTDVALFTERREHAAFARLREHNPVHRNPAPGGGHFWALTRHGHVAEVAMDMDRFISGRGTQIADKRAEGHGAPSVHNADRPIHTELRKAGQSALRRPMIEARRPRIEQIVSELVARAPRNMPFDFVEEIAVKIPMIVFSEVLGVPAHMQTHLVSWANTMSDVRASNSEQSDSREKLFAYFRELAAAKRKDPGEDIASSLVRGYVDGEIIEDEYLDAFFMVLTVAGNETTRFLLAGGLEQLCRSPDQMAHLRAHTEAASRKRAVEEMLRWVTPVIHMRRTAIEDCDLFGTSIRAGDKVVLYFSSGNRDERVFGVDAAEFDLSRAHNPHLAFGYGGHFCLGAMLARMESQIFFDEFTRTVSEVCLSDGPGERLPSHWFAGLQSLMVEWA